MEEFQIKAFNSDNGAELRMLRSFFEAHGGGKYPFAPLCDPDFWKSNGSSPLITLMALKGSSLLGCISLRSVIASEAACMEVLFPTFSEEALFSKDQLGLELNKIVNRQLLRTGSRHLISFSLPDFGLSLSNLKSLLGLTETAILPFEKTHPVLNDEYRGELVFCIRQAESYPHPENTREIYLPEHHQKFFRSLCRQARLPCRVAVETKSSMPGERPNNLLKESSLSEQVAPINHNGIVSKALRRFHTRLTLIDSSAISTLDSLHAALALQHSSDALPHHFLGTDVSHRDAAPLIAGLEMEGYRFCGLIPARYGKDYCILKERDDSKRPFSIQSTQILAESELARYLTAQRPIVDSSKYTKIHAHAV